MGMSHACVNSCPPGQNGRHFADDISKCIFMNEKFCILIRISQKFVPKSPIDYIPALVQIMAWRRLATSHYLIQCWIWLLTRPVIRTFNVFFELVNKQSSYQWFDTLWHQLDAPIMFDNSVILLLLLTSHVPEACIYGERDAPLQKSALKTAIY